MDYDKIIDLYNVTLEDCLRFEQNGKIVVIQEGQVVDFKEEDEDEKSKRD